MPSPKKSIEALKMARKAMAEATNVRAFAEAKAAAREARVAAQKMVPAPTKFFPPPAIESGKTIPMSKAYGKAPSEFLQAIGVEVRPKFDAKSKGGGSYNYTSAKKLPGAGLITAAEWDASTLLHEAGHAASEGAGRAPVGFPVGNSGSMTMDPEGVPAGIEKARALYRANPDELRADYMALRTGIKDDLYSKGIHGLNEEIEAIRQGVDIGGFDKGPAMPPIVAAMKAKVDSTSAKTAKQALLAGDASEARRLHGTEPLIANEKASKTWMGTGGSMRHAFGQQLRPSSDPLDYNKVNQVNDRLRSSWKMFPLGNIAEFRQQLAGPNSAHLPAVLKRDISESARRIYLQNVLDRARASRSPRYQELVKAIKQHYHDTTPGLRYGIAATALPALEAARRQAEVRRAESEQ